MVEPITAIQKGPDDWKLSRMESFRKVLAAAKYYNLSINFWAYQIL